MTLQFLSKTHHCLVVLTLFYSPRDEDNFGYYDDRTANGTSDLDIVRVANFTPTVCILCKVCSSKTVPKLPYLPIAFFFLLSLMVGICLQRCSDSWKPWLRWHNMCLLLVIQGCSETEKGRWGVWSTRSMHSIGEELSRRTAREPEGRAADPWTDMALILPGYRQTLSQVR